MDSLFLSKLSEYGLFQSRKRRENQARNLLYLRSVLILSGYSLAGIILLLPPRIVLGYFDSNVAAIAIFLILIPFSIQRFLFKWVKAGDKLCITRRTIYVFEQYIIEDFPDHTITLELKQKSSGDDQYQLDKFTIEFATNALHTVTVFGFLASLSLLIGFNQAIATNISSFAPGSLFFCYPNYQILLLARNLVKTINNKSNL